MKCFYHSADLDGHCSGAIIKLHHRDDCEMWPIDYHYPFPWKQINPGEVVYMVDFHLEPFDEMIRLSELCDLVWIDHHKSAIEEYNKRLPNIHIRGLREIGIGAAALVWKYVYLEEPLPVPVRLVAEYDVWNLSDPNTLAFQYGARLHSTDPSCGDGLLFWDKLLFPDRAMEPDGFLGTVVDDGWKCVAYQERLDAKYCKNVFIVTFEGLRCVALNAPYCNSKTFEAVWNANRYDAMLAFYMIGPDRWKVSMFTTKDDHDLSRIAKKYGGGGHQKAAGFICNKLPFMDI
ncbi:MAG: hypothetical protein JRJ31_22210 [Deltaproteobacteria bacterium]|nr:hypothetical protein [Deltaproteobacteria bacterium]